MKYPPLTDTEDARLACLRGLDILDTPPDARLDAITRTAAERYRVPMALISMVDRHRQWFKSRVGLDAEQTPRAYSFCGHAIWSSSEVFVVRDARSNSDFADNPLVIGPPHVRFYAGAKIVSPEGHAIGTLCIIDTEPRDIPEDALRPLAKLAGDCAAILFENQKEPQAG